MTTPRLLLDEHVGRLFERMLGERGYDVEQAKDRFAERTTDVDLLTWCADNGAVLLTNNAKDFDPLHRERDHVGILLYRDQRLPDADPEGLARAVDEVFNQYGPAGVENELVEVDEWYEWLHGRTGGDATLRFLHSATHRSCSPRSARRFPFLVFQSPP